MMQLIKMLSARKTLLKNSKIKFRMALWKVFSKRDTTGPIQKDATGLEHHLKFI